MEEDDDDRAMFMMSLIAESELGGSMSTRVKTELLELSRKKYAVLPRAVPKEFTYEGETVELTAEQRQEIAARYEDIPDTLDALFSRSAYGALSEEGRAAAISFVYDAYAGEALSYVTGMDLMSAKETAAQAVGLDTVAILQVKTSKITADKDRRGNTVPGSKRRKIVAEIRAMRLPAEETLLLICSFGYTIADGDVAGMNAEAAKRRLLRYIMTRRGMTDAQRAKLAQMCGFSVRNGKILRD